MACLCSNGGSNDQEQHAPDSEEACDLGGFVRFVLLDLELAFDLAQFHVQVGTSVKPVGLSRFAAQQNEGEQKEKNVCFHGVYGEMKKAGPIR